LKDDALNDKLPKLKDLTVDHSLCLRDVMEVIGRNGQGVSFIIDGDILCGIITDGDIRRALLNGHSINTKIEKIIRSEYTSLPFNSSLKAIQEALENFKIVPIIGNNGTLVDYASLNRYHQIPLTQPVFDGSELEYVTDCIKSGWISSQGSYVVKFENEFGKYVENSNCLAVSNGTVALHLALATLDIGPGDEVIVPNLTFAAPVNAILYQGATPVLCEVSKKTLTLDMNILRRLINSKTRAIVPVHLYGYAVEMDDLVKLANQNDIYIVEDCAEAFGTRYKDRHVGNFGDIGTFSFFGNKTITTGEGGMMVFKDLELMKKAKILRDHGMNPSKRYWHDTVGFNYRITNIQSAVGLGQIEKAKILVDAKRSIANSYIKYLHDLKEVELPNESVDVFNSYWLFTIVLDSKYREFRNSIIEKLALRGIEARPIFYPLHQMPPYKRFAKKDLTYNISSELSECGISLPSATTLSDEDIALVCKAFKEIIVTIDI
jgi:perosamine synthetase